MSLFVVFVDVDVFVVHFVDVRDAQCYLHDIVLADKNLASLSSPPAVIYISAVVLDR